MPDRYWIVKPIEHRKADRVAMMKRQAELRPDVFVQMLIPDSDDEWVCDYCNAEIPLFVQLEDETVVAVQVPCVGTNALCPDCASKEEGFPNSFRGVCVCDGCRPTQDPRLN